MNSRMQVAATVAFVAALAITTVAQSPAATYFPDRSDWQRRAPAEAGFDPAALDSAVKFAIANENPGPRDPVIAHAQTFGATEPFDALVGPVKERGALNGLIVRRGYVVADWGETTRVDMTHSVTKTFLSTVVGLAWQRGLIRSLDDRVSPYMPAGLSAPACLSRHTTSRLPGTICCGRRATGRARCGTSRTGPIVRKGRRAGGRSDRFMNPARATSTTMSG